MGDMEAENRPNYAWDASNTEHSESTHSKPSADIGVINEEDDNTLFDVDVLNCSHCIEENEISHDEEDDDVFEVGDIVDVAPRTWIGINRQGGRGKIKKCHHEAGTYDISYIVHRGSDKDVPKMFITRAEGSLGVAGTGGRLVKPRCRWFHCKCFIADCGHNQEIDEVSEAKKRAEEEKERAAAKLKSLKLQRKSKDQVLYKGGRSKNNEGDDEVKSEVWSKYHEKAKKDQERYQRQIAERDRSNQAAAQVSGDESSRLQEKQIRLPRSAFYYFWTAKRKKTVAELGVGHTKDELKDRLKAEWEKFREKQKRKQTNATGSLLKPAMGTKRRRNDSSCTASSSSASRSEVFQDADCAESVQENEGSVETRKKGRSSRRDSLLTVFSVSPQTSSLSYGETKNSDDDIGDDSEDGSDDDDDEVVISELIKKRKGRQRRMGGLKLVRVQYNDDEVCKLQHQGVTRKENIQPDGTFAGRDYIGEENDTMADEDALHGIDRHREMDMNFTTELRLENDDKYFIDRAKQRAIQEQGKGMAVNHLKGRENEDALFIQPEGNAFRMPSDVEEKLKSKYGHCCHQDLLGSLSDIYDKAIVLKNNLSALRDLCMKVPSMIASASRSLQLQVLSMDHPESSWYHDIKQWVQRYTSSSSKCNQEDTHVSKLDVCAIIRQLFFEFDSIQYEFTDECADAREYIRQKLRAIRKRGSDYFDVSKVPMQKAFMGRIELVENDFGTERRMTLEIIKEMYKKFEDRFHASVDDVWQYELDEVGGESSADDSDSSSNGSESEVEEDFYDENFDYDDSDGSVQDDETVNYDNSKDSTVSKIHRRAFLRTAQGHSSAVNQSSRGESIDPSLKATIHRSSVDNDGNKGGASYTDGAGKKIERCRTISNGHFVRLKKVFGFDNKITLVEGASVVYSTGINVAIESMDNRAVNTAPPEPMLQMNMPIDKSTSSTVSKVEQRNELAELNCIDKIAELIDLEKLIGVDDKISKNETYTVEANDDITITTLFMELNAYITCCLVYAVDSSELVDILEKIELFLESMTLNCDTLSVFVRECIYFESQIYQRSDLYEDGYFSSYLTAKIKWIHFFFQKSCHVKPMAVRRKLQQLLQSLLEQAMSQIMFYVLDHKVEIIAAVEEGYLGSDSNHRCIEYLQLMCHAISVSISAMFYETLTTCQTFWIPFNRIYCLYLNLCRIMDNTSLVTTWGRIHHDIVLRHVDYSSHCVQSVIVNLAITSTPSLNEMRLESSALDLFFYLFLMSTLIQKVADRRHKASSMSRIPSNWNLVVEAHNAMMSSKHVVPKALINSNRVFFLQHLHNLSSIWDAAETGMGFVLTMTPHLLRSKKKSGEESKKTSVFTAPSGIEKFLVEDKQKAEETLLAETEANLFDEALWLLDREIVMGSQLFLNRQKGSYNFSDVVDRTSDLITAFYRVNGLPILAQSHEEMSELISHDEKSSGTNNILVFEKMSRVEVAHEIGKALKGILACSNKDKSNIHFKRLKENLAKQYTSPSIVSTLSSVGRTRETAALNSMILSEVIPEIYHIVGHFDMCKIDEQKGVSLYEKLLNVVEPRDRRSSKVRATEWLLAYKLATNFRTDYLVSVENTISNGSNEEVLLPPHQLVQVITEATENELRSFSMLQKRSIYEIVAALVLGNKYLFKLNLAIRDCGSVTPSVLSITSTIRLSLVYNLLKLASVALNHHAGPANGGLHSCGVLVIRNLASTIIDILQISSGTSSIPAQTPVYLATQLNNIVSSESLEKILLRLPKMVHPLGISLKSLVNDFSPINKSTHMESSWKQSILVIETCSLCCIVSILLENVDDLYVHCPTGKHIICTLKSSQMKVDSHSTIREVMGIISRVVNDKISIVDKWFQCVFWTPMLRASYLFRLFLQAVTLPISPQHNYEKFRPIVCCVTRKMSEIFSAWVSCLCTLQLYPNLASPQEVGISLLCTCLLQLFDSKVICPEDMSAVTTSVCRKIGNLSSSISFATKYHQIMFTSNRFGIAFEDAVSTWESQNDTRLLSQDFFRRLEQSSFEVSIPLLAYYFRSLSQIELNSQTTKEMMWKEHNRLMGDLKRCTHVLMDSSVQAKSFDRVKRLSEVKAINSLLAGEMSRVLSTDDIRVLIKEFTAQVQTIFDMRSRAERDLEKMSVIRYFPLYIRSISSTAFSTKIYEWRCILSELSTHLKENKEDSKVYDVMDNIVCSLLISLILPATTPSYAVIQNNASGYLHLLKIVQARASWAWCPLSSSYGSYGGKFAHESITIDNRLNSVQAKLDIFLEYLLYHETSFIDAIKDKKKIDYDKDVPRGVNLQSLMILKLMKVERIMKEIKMKEVSGDVYQPAVSALLEHMPSSWNSLPNQVQRVDLCFTNLPLSEGMILATISTIALLTTQIFRMVLGESSNAVVHIIPYRRTENSIRDLLDRILGADMFLLYLMRLLNRNSCVDSEVPIEEVVRFVSGKTYQDSILHEILPCWKGLMRQFCVIFMVDKSPSSSIINHKILDSRTGAFLRSTNELIAMFQSRCSRTTTCDVPALVEPEMASLCGPCNNNCIACKTSFHRINLIQNNAHNAARRISVKREDGTNMVQATMAGNYDEEMIARVQGLMEIFGQ